MDLMTIDLEMQRPYTSNCNLHKSPRQKTYARKGRESGVTCMSMRTTENSGDEDEEFKSW